MFGITLVAFMALMMLLVPLGIVAMREGGIWLIIAIADALATIYILFLLNKLRSEFLKMVLAKERLKK